MTTNMGTADRAIRTVLAVTFGVLYGLGVVTGTLGLVLVILGVVFLLTSLFGFCPLYLPVGLSTKGAKPPA